MKVDICYEIDSRRAYDPIDALADAITAKKRGERAKAIAALESGLQSLYLGESPDFSKMGLVEQMLANLLSESGERERADVCHILAKAHFEIGAARTPGANAPDALGVPYPGAERQDGAQQ